MKILHAAAEMFPLVKTGGLADVIGALPQALAAEGAEVRLLLPGLPAVLQGLAQPRRVCDIGAVFGAARVTLWFGRFAHSGVDAYVVDAPYLYCRPGNPYQDAAGIAWSDNAQRFALLGWVAAHLAAGELDSAWTPELLHAHDWHAGLACAYVAAHPGTRAATVFTVHNLQYQGLFDAADYHLTGLPSRFMARSGLEFHGQVSFMKAGLSFSQRVTTVSSSYAAEITTEAFGCGMDGVLRARAGDLCGILNGVDGAVWNPQTDTAIARPYSRTAMHGKAECKARLQQALGLQVDPQAPLFAVVSRLSPQKGLDLVLAVLPELLAQGAQLVLQGSGDADLEQAFADAALRFRGQVAVRLVYDEAYAHQIIAGADAIVLPSRFEPCGLTQLYGLRYATIPVVRRVGGLIDTVVDADAQALAEKRATGFAFGPASADALAQALSRAVAMYRQRAAWAGLMDNAMAQDFSWAKAAKSYMQLYRDMLAPRA